MKGGYGVGNLTWLDALGGKIEAAAAKALLQAGKKIQGDAKRLCPVGSGRLRNNIDVRQDYEDGDVVVTVGTNVDYGPYVEFGTGPVGAAGPKDLPEGADIQYRKTPWAYRDPKTGRFVRTNGQPARQFLYPAAKRNEAYVREHVAKAVQAAAVGAITDRPTN